MVEFGNETLLICNAFIQCKWGRVFVCLFVVEACNGVCARLLYMMRTVQTAKYTQLKIIIKTLKCSFIKTQNVRQSGFI